jgi:hypothetical protein
MVVQVTGRAQKRFVIFSAHGRLNNVGQQDTLKLAANQLKYTSITL